ncbi:OTU domain-containing protein 1-like [Scleropages formosus]|nr:OTU domain-containing protein 1-like [Scleropages formosus]
MPALSCYESSEGHSPFPCSLEIIISGPNGLKRVVPVCLVREPGSDRGSHSLYSLRPRRVQCEENDEENSYNGYPEWINEILDQLKVKVAPAVEQKQMGVRLTAESVPRLIQEPPEGSRSRMGALERFPLEEESPLEFNKTGNEDKLKNYLTEVEKQNEYLQDRCKYRFQIIPDGNCLYRAMSQALYGDQSRHAELREQTVYHIADHLEELGPTIEGDVGGFLISAAQDGEWAGYTELLAISHLLDTNIHVTTGGSPQAPTVSSMVHCLGPEDPSKPSIWLSWLSCGHYDVVLDKRLDNPEYEAWWRQRQQQQQEEETVKSLAESLSQMYTEYQSHS